MPAARRKSSTTKSYTRNGATLTLYFLWPGYGPRVLPQIVRPGGPLYALLTKCSVSPPSDQG